ncbi:MAG: hypothetical protein PHO37_02715 [Kiritimatiellae bacterium]|nr:hypothetical protein [Kiritimatiellia bacterium]
MNLTYSREDDLINKLNQFLLRELHLPEADYTNKFTLESLLSLKSVLSDINNLITLKLTCGLASWVCDTYSLEEDIRASLCRSVMRKKPNANGFDLYLGVPMSFVAEVKCNLPINGGLRYGAQQKRGILSDVESLMTGKRKSPMMSQKVLKFLGFLDLPAIRAANEHLIKTTPALAEKLRFVQPKQKPRALRYVHGVYIPIKV